MLCCNLGKVACSSVTLTYAYMLPYRDVPSQQLVPCVPPMIFLAKGGCWSIIAHAACDLLSRWSLLAMHDLVAELAQPLCAFCVDGGSNCHSRIEEY
jgi:hypothetical protein